MTESSDNTKEVLTEALQQLYGQAAKAHATESKAFLQSGDGTFLGKITENPYDRDSINNPYGPYGSIYSPTSIHNSYSVYGSLYSPLSINNIYAANPPVLYIGGRPRGRVTKNPYVRDRIDTQVFLFLLEKDIRSLIENRIPNSISVLQQQRGEAYLLAADGTYLGSLNPNRFDNDSIFNKFGPYGSRFSPTSIFNKYGTYGSKFSSLSPFNRFSSSPPSVILKGNPVAFVTVNKFVAGNKVDPDKLEDWARRFVTRTW